MKDILKGLLMRCIRKYYSTRNPLNHVQEKFKILLDFIYSEKYCKLFNCKDVEFRRPLNLIKGAKYFSIGGKTKFGKHSILTAWDSYENDTFSPEVKIGENCSFGDHLHLTCIKRIIIGNGVLTGRWVTISDNNHGKTDYDTLRILPSKRRLTSKGAVEIENNVWIGDKATILSGVKIGEGTVVAANSVVTKDIPSYSIVAGNPAKIIKQNIKL